MTSKPRLSPQREEILRLYAKGSTVIEIAEKTGVSRQRIYTQLANLELPVPTKRDRVSA
jgi:DNA-binding NarL/FixJ family response regulator